ncbi:MAG: RNA polymerase sigma factor [Pseudomonadota bacterium]
MKVTGAVSISVARGLCLSEKQPSLVRMAVDREADQIKRAAGGDPAAIRAIVVRNTAPLNALAYRMLRSQEDAEEVVQETFLRAWKALPKWKPNAQLSTWLHRVALNLCYDRLRKRREHVMAEPPDIVDETPGPQGQLERQQSIAKVRDALAQLPERQQAALSLCALEGYTNKMAAEILEISVEALESLLSRGRRQLRSILHEQAGDLT